MSKQSKGVDLSARKSWDKEVYQKKADDRAKREAEEGEKELTRSKFLSLLSNYVFIIIIIIIVSFSKILINLFYCIILCFIVV
jgi:hypothetical protein